MTTVSAQSPGSLPHLPVAGFRLASDARLARLATAGSAGAMTAIFERHHEALHRYCWSIVGNGHDAADALQNTMIKALRALPGETREIALRPWLYRIAHNESISLLRARRPDSDLDAASQLSDLAGADAVDARERMRALSRDLSELTERQRSALLMRELGGLQFSEVASALGTSPAAAKQSVYEARCALQSLEEGRAMDCDAIRRTISDGDRRALKAIRVRGHLRACAGCNDFERAMGARPQQFAALIPPLPAVAAAAILQSIGGGAGAGGGGLLAGLAGAAKATTGLSVAAKLGATVAVTAALGGGAVVAVPLLEHGGADRPAPASAAGPGQPATQRGSGSGSAILPAGKLRLAGGSSTLAGAVGPARDPAAAATGSGPGAGATTTGAGAAATAHGRPGATGGGSGASSPGRSGTARKSTGKGAGNSAAGANRSSTASAHGKPAATATGRPATPPVAANSVATTKRPQSPAGQGTAQAKQLSDGSGEASSAGPPATVVVPQIATDGPAAGSRVAPGVGRIRP